MVTLHCLTDICNHGPVFVHVRITLMIVCMHHAQLSCLQHRIAVVVVIIIVVVVADVALVVEARCEDV